MKKLLFAFVLLIAVTACTSQTEKVIEQNDTVQTDSVVTDSVAVDSVVA